MRKKFLIISLFTAGLITSSCQTYEERHAELSEERVEDVELEEEEEPQTLEFEEDEELGNDEIEVEKE